MKIHTTTTVNYFKLNRIILLFILFNFVCTTKLFAQANILEQTLSVNLPNHSIQEALNEITTKTGYYFIYNAALFQKQTKFKSQQKQKKLKTILNEIFQDTTLSYKLIDKYIVISKPKIENEISQKIETQDSVILINGKIIDGDNRSPLYYAAIGLLNENIGTIANEEGCFTLKLLKKHVNSVLNISHLGYKPVKIPIKQLNNQLNIFPLQKDVISLQEIIIRNRDPLTLLINALKNIKGNYFSQASTMTGFYREAVKKNNEYVLVSEAALQIHKASYTKLFDRDQVKVLKSRKFSNIDKRDTMIMKLKGGISSCLLMDIIKNPVDFLIENNFKDYNFQYPDIVRYNDESAFSIPFEQKENVTDPCYTGNIFINMANSAIIGAVFEIHPSHIEKIQDQYIVKNKGNFKITTKKVNYRVSYRLLNNKYYLNHVRCEMTFKVKKKKQLFSRNYFIFFELAVNDIDTLNNAKIPRKEEYNTSSIFSDAIGEYDKNFWGNENIIQPDAPLEKALIEISKKIIKKIK